MSEIILITGGAGCLGQHIIKHLQEDESGSSVKEIRVLDLVPYVNRLNHREKIRVTSITADITKNDTILKNAFKDVDLVYHCAALMSISFPPRIEELERVNVEGTSNVVNLCVENNVKYLIYTSDILVTLTPFTKMGMFGAVVNETESKTKMPTTDEQFLIPAYPPSKLRGEKLVLDANGKPISNGNDFLKTCALRFPIMYGEEERVCFTKLIALSEKWNSQIPKIAGDGGKHQLIYAGNAAWGHLCARNVLKSDPEKIAGLPVSLTDESPIYDIFRFTNVMLTRNSDVLKVRPTSWKIPFLLAFIVAMVFEFFVGLLNKVTGYQLEYSPKTIISYCGSLTLWSRMRAAIQMGYDPLYTPEEAMKRSAKWYEKWYLEEFKNKKKDT